MAPIPCRSRRPGNFGSAADRRRWTDFISIEAHKVRKWLRNNDRDLRCCPVWRRQDFADVDHYRSSSNLNDSNSKLLAEGRKHLVTLIADARNEADYHRGVIASTHRIDLLPTRLDLLPTRVGDARRITERYSEDTYQVDFDYVWTRIQMLLPKEDTEFLKRVGDAQSQVSFSVLALSLMLTVPPVWLPILLVTATTPWLFLAIGFLSPALVLFLYELVVQSQSVFGEVVRAAIDKYRIQVLTEVMRQPLPATLAAERLLWRGLSLASVPANAANLNLTHKKEP